MAQTAALVHESADDGDDHEGSFRIAGLSGGPMMPLGFQIMAMQADAAREALATAQEIGQVTFETSQALVNESLRMQRVGLRMIPGWGKLF